MLILFRVCLHKHYIRRGHGPKAHWECLKCAANLGPVLDNSDIPKPRLTAPKKDSK